MQEAEDSKMDDKPLYMPESDDIETDSQEDQEEYLCDGCGRLILVRIFARAYCYNNWHKGSLKHKELFYIG